MEGLLKIRAFMATDQDYEGVARLNALAGPDGFLDFEAWTAPEVRAIDASFDPSRYVFQRYVAEATDTGALVGYAQYSHMPWSFDPGKYWVGVRVDPEHRRRGIGGQLYARVLDDLTRRGAHTVWIQTREKDTAAASALARRGFHEILHSVEFALDVRSFDRSRLINADERQKRAEVKILTLPELIERDPDWIPKLYDIHTMILKDVPIPDDLSINPSQDQFLDYVLRGPGCLPDACFVALDAEGTYIGECVMHTGEEEGTLDHLVTGVRPEHRGRGVAQALKLKTIEYALAHGYGRIATWVESNNPSMLAINEKLGFARVDGLIVFEKTIPPTSAP